MTLPLPSRADLSQNLKRFCSSLAFVIAAAFTASAQCPEKTGDPNFVEGETYHVDIDVRFGGTTVEEQIVRALGSWNFANKHVNKTNIEFKVITNWNEVPPGARR